MAIIKRKIPKQLLNLTNEMSMLQNTVMRSKKLDCGRIIICNKEHAFIIENQINELNLDMSTITIISEPIGRDSAAAICISALIGDIEDYTIVMPSDHVMHEDEFINCCNKAITKIDNAIITFGIKPTRI
jgi:mannose-1-phosphate guanylyltransferase